MKDAIEAVKGNTAMSVLTGFIGLLSLANIGTLVQAVRTYDSLATEKYVSTEVSGVASQWQGELQLHIKDYQEQVAGVQETIDRIDANTRILPELKNLLTLQCMGVQNLEATIDRLEAEYAGLADEAFDRDAWPCERLLRE